LLGRHSGALGSAPAARRCRARLPGPCAGIGRARPRAAGDGRHGSPLASRRRTGGRLRRGGGGPDKDAVMKRVLAMALLTVGLVAGVLAGAPDASAHATRIATDPAENAELTESPATVSATFNEAMQPQFAAMTVVGPDGNLWSTGEP